MLEIPPWNTNLRKAINNIKNQYANRMQNIYMKGTEQDVYYTNPKMLLAIQMDLEIENVRSKYIPNYKIKRYKIICY